jgi:hypothetical protein
MRSSFQKRQNCVNTASLVADVVMLLFVGVGQDRPEIEETSVFSSLFGWNLPLHHSSLSFILAYCMVLYCVVLCLLWMYFTRTAMVDAWSMVAVKLFVC